MLSQDAADYEQHKILLVKALKWEGQKRNSSILLRGYNIRNYTARTSSLACSYSIKTAILLHLGN